eukprot:PhF_6_TR2307/c0_g2_i1/m.4057
MKRFGVIAIAPSAATRVEGNEVIFRVAPPNTGTTTPPTSPLTPSKTITPNSSFTSTTTPSKTKEVFSLPFSSVCRRSEEGAPAMLAAALKEFFRAESKDALVCATFVNTKQTLSDILIRTLFKQCDDDSRTKTENGVSYHASVVCVTVEGVEDRLTAHPRKKHQNLMFPTPVRARAIPMSDVTSCETAMRACSGAKGAVLISVTASAAIPSGTVTMTYRAGKRFSLLFLPITGDAVTNTLTNADASSLHRMSVVFMNSVQQRAPSKPVGKSSSNLIVDLLGTEITRGSLYAFADAGNVDHSSTVMISVLRWVSQLSEATTRLNLSELEDNKPAQTNSGNGLCVESDTSTFTSVNRNPRAQDIENEILQKRNEYYQLEATHKHNLDQLNGLIKSRQTELSTIEARIDKAKVELCGLIDRDHQDDLSQRCPTAFELVGESTREIQRLSGQLRSLKETHTETLKVIEMQQFKIQTLDADVMKRDTTIAE